MLKTFLEFSPNKEELEENRKLFEGEDVCKVNTNKIEPEENKELFEDKEFSTNQIEEKKKLFEDESNEEPLHLAKKKQFKPLKISKYKSKEFYQSSIGKYAVIYLDFNNANAISENFEEILRNVVKTACNPYEYLYQQYLTKIIKNYFERNNINIDISKESLNDLEHLIEDYSISLNYSFEKFKKYLKGDKTININGFLEFIVDFFQENLNLKSYLLVDEYDLCLNRASNLNEFNDIKEQLAAFLSETKTNISIEKAILVGIMPIFLGIQDTIMNHFIYCSILDPEFGNCFGFTEDEVKFLCKHFFKKNVRKECKNKIISWYNGYNINNFIIYNP